MDDPYIILQLELKLKDQKNRETASDLYYSVQHIYKDWDYRCLVPYSHKDPRKWKTYEMHDYRKAFNEKQLKKVDQFKYDNNFANMVDPKVLKYYTKSTKSSKKAGMKSYGYPYVAHPYVTLSPTNETIKLTNSTKCLKKCARYVSSYYT